jgi:hypothetical protein
MGYDGVIIQCCAQSEGTCNTYGGSEDLAYVCLDGGARC